MLNMWTKGIDIALRFGLYLLNYLNYYFSVCLIRFFCFSRWIQNWSSTLRIEVFSLWVRTWRGSEWRSLNLKVSESPVSEPVWRCSPYSLQLVSSVTTDHPYFVGVQFHPEFTSRPIKPSPPYFGLLLAASGKLQNYLQKGCRLSPR